MNHAAAELNIWVQDNLPRPAKMWLCPALTCHSICRGCLFMMNMSLLPCMKKTVRARSSVGVNQPSKTLSTWLQKIWPKEHTYGDVSTAMLSEKLRQMFCEQDTVFQLLLCDLYLNFILLKCEWWSQCKRREKRMEYSLQCMNGTLRVWQRKGVTLRFLVLQYVERSQVGTLCSSTMCAAVCFGKMCILREKAGCFDWGEWVREKLENIRQLHRPGVPRRAVERLQLCWNTLAGNLCPCVVFLIVFEIKLEEGWKSTWT